jgi:glycerophosphoryl diester phosphodiesterase
MSKRKVVLLTVLILVVAAVAYVLLKPIQPVPAHPYFTNPSNVLVIAHRGGRGLWPENTLYGFRRAFELGVDVLEMDIRVTADGALVAHHDEKVDRTTDGRGRIEELTLEEIKRLDAGFAWTDDDGTTYPCRDLGIQVPALQEVFSELPDARFVIEIKPPSIEVAISLCRTIRDYGMEENVLVSSFHREAVDEFRESCPSVATGATPGEAFSFFQLNRFRLDFMQTPVAEALQVPPTFGGMDVLTPRFLSTAKKFNLQVHVWTVNDIVDMKRLVALEVGGIMTDYPDRLMEVLGRELSSIDGEGDNVR